MAAAEYYHGGGGGGSGGSGGGNGGPIPPPNMNQSPVPARIQALQQQHQHQQPQQPQQPPYPISDAPPPYTPYDDSSRPHSQPPPQNRVRFEDEHRPSPPSARDSYYNNNNFRPPPQNYGSNEKMRPPPSSQPYGAPYHNTQQPYPPHQNGYYPSQGPSPAPAVQSQTHLDPSGYRPQAYSPQPLYAHERSRSRSQDRRHKHRDHHSHRHRDDPPTKKKGSGVTTFLGAGGGALIGDAIFPGLGTLGGAILGGLGGHEYTKQKRDYHNSGRMSRRSHSTADIDYYEDDHGRGRRR